MEFIEEFDQIIALAMEGDPREILYNATNEEVFVFAETLALSAKYHFADSGAPNKNFSFTANSSLSGGRHPCSEISCRTSKLDELVSFSAIYADEVYIQNPFEYIMMLGPEGINNYARDEVVHGILNYFYLRPLIEKGIIKYAQNVITLCDHHSTTLGKPLSQEIERKEGVLHSALAEKLIDHCKITLGRNDTCAFLEIKGPSEFIDHGVSFLHFYYETPEYLAEFLNQELPYVFSKTEIIEYGLLSYIIMPILEDLSNQEWHSSFFGTSYLCDNPLQMKLASKLNSKAYAASSASLNNALNHTLPTILAKDLSHIVKLRDREEEAFAVYRDKIHGLLKNTNDWSESEVHEAFRDEVLPEINIINKKIKDWKVRAQESLKERLIFGTGAVTIGLYSGMLPPNISQLVAAVGGGAAITGAVMDLNKITKEKDEARLNDYYFLWEASK